MRAAMVLASLMLIVPQLAGQHFVTHDGTRLDAAQVERRGSVLVVMLLQDTSAGEVEQMFPIEDIARLEWPRPPALELARRALEQGDLAAAAAAVDPVIETFAPYARVKGNWWSEAAIIKAEICLVSGDTVAAAQLVQRVLALATTTEVSTAARLLFVEIDLRQGQPELAEAMLSDIAARDGLSSDHLARIAALRGEIHLARSAAEEALGAFLEVPAHYPRAVASLPRALAGASRAYAALGDAVRSRRALADLARRFPGYPSGEQGHVQAAVAGIPFHETD